MKIDKLYRRATKTKMFEDVVSYVIKNYENLAKKKISEVTELAVNNISSESIAELEEAYADLDKILIDIDGLAIFITKKEPKESDPEEPKDLIFTAEIEERYQFEALKTLVDEGIDKICDDKNVNVEICLYSTEEEEEAIFDNRNTDNLYEFRLSDTKLKQFTSGELITGKISNGLDKDQWFKMFTDDDDASDE